MKCQCGFTGKTAEWYQVRLDGYTNDFELNSYFPNYSSENKRSVSERQSFLFSCPRCGLIYNYDNEDNR